MNSRLFALLILAWLAACGSGSDKIVTVLLAAHNGSRTTGRVEIGPVTKVRLYGVVDRQYIVEMGEGTCADPSLSPNAVLVKPKDWSRGSTKGEIQSSFPTRLPIRTPDAYFIRAAHEEHGRTIGVACGNIAPNVLWN